MGTLVQTDGKTACFKLASGLEPDRFIGAPIQTSSGVRGKIDKSAGYGIVECTFKDNIRIGDTFLFPVLATLVLPSLFRQLNLLFKHLETPTIATDDVYAAITDGASATINFVATATVHFGTSIAADADDELVVSYKEDVPMRQIPYQRRGVRILEGRCQFFSFPDPLEMEKRSIKRRKRCASHEISGEVKEKHSSDRSGGEVMVIVDDESVPALELFLQRYPPPEPGV
ncbi:hypothetical protein MKW98_007402 [Papaver atlanticum]|uniref:Uncharacterized protein n=1 Tax=Papaver atlanticum TaxID=357466 RepID=A0AAD4SB56_9MAGN|nr:hypothetical protein MKW98_007402 [Papaver atlanticum]